MSSISMWTCPECDDEVRVWNTNTCPNCGFVWERPGNPNVDNVEEDIDWGENDEPDWDYDRDEEYDALYPPSLFADEPFADPGGRSALRAASPSNPRNQPCPTCGRKNVLTPADVRRGYQCDRCADIAEGRIGSWEY